MDLPTLFLVNNMMCDDFEEPKINYFDQLPPELHSKIVKNIFDLAVYKDEDCKQHINLEKLEKYVPEMPILLGIKVADEFSQFQRIFQPKINGKKLLAHELFVLPRRERDAFVRLANRSSFLEDDLYVDDYQIIVNTPKNIKEGLWLRVNHLHPALNRTMNMSVLGLFLGLFSFVVALNGPIGMKRYSKAVQVIIVGNFGNIVTCMLCGLLAGPRYGPNGYLKDVKL
jgi:hypothetical protein